MPIYDKPTKELMRIFAGEKLTPGQTFEPNNAVQWFSINYPKIQPATVRIHVDAMAVNSESRKHHKNIRAGSGHDLFFKLGPGKYRLWDEKIDPAPVYYGQSTSNLADAETKENINSETAFAATAGEQQEFAYESDLRNYLAKNLNSLETGLRLYEEDEIEGIEFPVGGRYIDILARDTENNFIVIELKVSRGYERTIGQILRYMAWVKKNLAQGKHVRGIIVAKEISEDLRLAASLIPDIRLAEYEIEFRVKPVSPL